VLDVRVRTEWCTECRDGVSVGKFSSCFNHSFNSLHKKFKVRFMSFHLLVTAEIET